MKNPHQSLSSLIQFVRKNSPFYKELYRTLPKKIHSIKQLPVLDQEAFWVANRLEKNRLLTGPMKDGLILKSGGTTGKPKFSIFSRDEWDEFTRTFAHHLAKTALKPGDRVANLFYVGDLYGSFIFTHKVLELCPTRTLQLPISGITAVPTMLKTIIEYKATVLAGLPTTLMTLLDAIDHEFDGAHHQHGLKIRTILFAGEPMQPNQREWILKFFPNTKIQSIGYASNDAGLLGYTDKTCGPNEFRTYDGEAIYEIIDELTGEPITQAGIEGRSVVTALKRSLMPIIRYPVGDRAKWLEPKGAKNRKYLLLGRSDEGARIASLTVRYDDVEIIIRRFTDRFPDLLSNLQFQLVVTQEGIRDRLHLKIAAGSRLQELKSLETEIIREIEDFHPIYRKFVDEGKINPIQIEWSAPGSLAVNPRTGKLKRILDLRAPKM